MIGPFVEFSVGKDLPDRQLVQLRTRGYFRRLQEMIKVPHFSSTFSPNLRIMDTEKKSVNFLLSEYSAIVSRALGK